MFAAGNYQGGGPGRKILKRSSSAASPQAKSCLDYPRIPIKVFLQG